MRSTPESASLPSSGMTALLVYQPGLTTVSFVGSVSSTRTVCERSCRLPAPSTADVYSVCVPVPVTCALFDGVYGSAGSRRHSPWTGEVASETLRLTLTGPCCQPEFTLVLLTGTVVSMRTSSETHGVQSPVTFSWARWEKV